MHTGRGGAIDVMRRHWTSTVVLATACTLAGCYSGRDGGGAGQDDADGGGTADGDGDGDADDDDDDDDDDPPPVECDGQVLDPGPNLVRRLTVREYGNTVEALLGVDIREQAELELPEELRADGFTNSASGLITTLDHVEAYDELAALAVEQIPDLATFTGGYTDCQDFTDDCERQFVESFGRKAFRRPLEDDEVDLLALVFDIAQAEGESFEVGAGLVVEAMMQSPPFLYRLEDETTGTVSRPLSGYEMASRLSYLLWAGPPDDELLDAADTESLSDDEQVIAQVDRMLADPRAQEASLGFVRDWLHLSRLNNLPRDPERFPDWSLAIAEDMRAETEAYFSSVAWDQERALTELFTAQETWLTPELAAYYGLAGGDPGLVQYDVSDVPERGGLLTQGSMLTIGGDDASMVARGLFVFENILCSLPASPPEGVDTTPPELEPGKSQRFYSEERTTNESCMGCHLQFEPLAWGLERYLADGTYTTQDFYGNELREDGELRLPGQADPAPYQSASEMMSLLEDSDAVRECIAKKGTQFAVARPLMPSDACSVGKIFDSLEQSDGTWRDLVVAIALSPGFRSIRVEG